MPTASEAGLPGFEVDFWIGYLTRAGTPRVAIERVNSEVNKILREPAIRERMIVLVSDGQSADLGGGAAEQIAAELRAAVLGANDYITPTGFGAVSYGYWLDAAGTAYDRKYTAAVGSDTANLYVRHGDDAPEFGFTATAGSYSTSGGTTSGSFVLSESMSVVGLTPSHFQLTAGAGTVSATSASLTSNSLNFGYSGGALAGVLRVQYNGTDIKDLQGDELRYKNMTLGTSNADSMDDSASTVARALFGGNGNDNIKGGSGSDFVMGQAGNDVLSGGAGGDTFRFIQFETGTDTVTDFKVSEGDKIDLRGILTDTGFTEASKALYLQISVNGTDATLKVDTLGIGNFSAPDQTITLLNAQGLSLTLDQLLAQRVILV